MIAVCRRDEARCAVILRRGQRRNGSKQRQRGKQHPVVGHVEYAFTRYGKAYIHIVYYSLWSSSLSAFIVSDGGFCCVAAAVCYLGGVLLLEKLNVCAGGFGGVARTTRAEYETEWCLHTE